MRALSYNLCACTGMLSFRGDKIHQFHDDHNLTCTVNRIIYARCVHNRQQHKPYLALTSDFPDDRGGVPVPVPDVNNDEVACFLQCLKSGPRR